MEKNEIYLKGFKDGWKVATENFENYMRIKINKYSDYCKCDKELKEEQ